MDFVEALLFGSLLTQDTATPGRAHGGPGAQPPGHLRTLLPLHILQDPPDPLALRALGPFTPPALGLPFPPLFLEAFDPLTGVRIGTVNQCGVFSSGLGPDDAPGGALPSDGPRGGQAQGRTWRRESSN